MFGARRGGGGGIWDDWVKGERGNQARVVEGVRGPRRLTPHLLFCRACLEPHQLETVEASAVDVVTAVDPVVVPVVEPARTRRPSGSPSPSLVAS